MAAEQISEAPGLIEQAPQQQAPAARIGGGAQRLRQLQRSAGNRALSLMLQPKLTVGPAGDRWEREADMNAAAVMRYLEQSRSAPAVEDPPRGAHLPMARAIQAKPASSMIGREGGSVDAETDAAIQRETGRGAPLDEGLRRSMEGGFGADFSGVRVHADANSADLSQRIQAKAFTTGNDIFFGKGQYRPGSSGGQELLAHELAHTLQQGASGGTVGRRPELVQRVFAPATVTSAANLRDHTDLDTPKGGELEGKRILANDTLIFTKPPADPQSAKVDFIGAVVIPPESQSGEPPGADRIGVVPKDSVEVDDENLRAMYRRRITDLVRANSRCPQIVEGLTRKVSGFAGDQLDFLVLKHLRVDVWESEMPAKFAAGFAQVKAKMDRIESGAKYLDDSLEHWRKWLHPAMENKVTVERVDFTASDLHERGLGVVRVIFKKPPGPKGHTFAKETTVDVMIKPEDKSLENALVGSGPDSAASKINEIVGLKKSSEKLTTFKMESDQVWGSLIERVKGMGADEIGGKKKAGKAFHETLVFAYLAGLDDLHRDNVLWTKDGRAYLIDADNAMRYERMQLQNEGGKTQSGFGGNYNEAAAQQNLDDIKAGRNSQNTVGSKILDAMLNDSVKRLAIIDALKVALKGKKARAVPVITNAWATELNGFTKKPQGERTAALDRMAHRDFLVRDNVAFDASKGPGLAGCAGVGAAFFYDEAAERKHLETDFKAGSIPFYEYELATGHIWHGTDIIYHGMTVDEVMNNLLAKWSPPAAN